MKNRSGTAKLLDTIQLLEAEQAVKLQLMKGDFRQAYQSIHPAHLIQNALKEISDSPHLVNNIVSAGVGLAAGYVSKIAIIGRSNNVLNRFLGAVLQLGITYIIAKNPKKLKFLSPYISHRMFHQEE